MAQENTKTNKEFTVQGHVGREKEHSAPVAYQEKYVVWKR